MGNTTFVTDPQTTARMRRVGQKATRAETRVRAAAFSLGLRYRTNVRDLPGRPDLANKSRKWAIFVHGCFWHDHQGCRYATKPARNEHLWKQKLHRNRERDEENVAQLIKAGYLVLVVWECEIRDGAAVRRKLSRLCDREPR